MKYNILIEPPIIMHSFISHFGAVEKSQLSKTIGGCPELYELGSRLKYNGQV